MNLVGLFFGNVLIDNESRVYFSENPGVSVILIYLRRQKQKVSKTNEGVKVESKKFFHFLIRGMEDSPACRSYVAVCTIHLCEPFLRR